MQKPALWILILAAGGAWLFFRHYEIRGLDGLELSPRDTQHSTTTDSNPVAARAGKSIRVASFNIQVLGPTKMGKPHVVEILARIIREFDLVAIQEVRSSSDDVVPQLVDAINAAGRHYDYVVGPRLGRTRQTEQFAYIFDLSSLEVDRTQVYTIEDPEDLLHRPPLVAWFRVRGPPPEQAFTFTLVNVHLDPDEVARELPWMDDVMRLVRDDGRGEDDVIVLGDFNAGDRELATMVSTPGLAAVVQGMPTNTRATAQYDNLLIHRPASVEFTGKGGAFDFLRQYNLSVEAALEVSDHLPVWAEFRTVEGEGQL